MRLNDLMLRTTPSWSVQYSFFWVVDGDIQPVVVWHCQVAEAALWIPEVLQ